MLQILTIAVRQIMQSFELAIKTSQIQTFSRVIKKAANLVISLGFPHFIFWKKNRWALFVFHNKEM